MELRNQPVIRKPSRRARRISLAVRLDGQAVLTVPFGMSENAVTRFLENSREWLARQSARLAKYRNDTFLPRARKDYLVNKAAARVLVSEILSILGPKYGYRWKKVFIKDLSRNWGSCSTRSNLNFNYKLVLLPRHLAEYVVFHELCHLEAFNHSERFWSLVAREFPTHKALRRELRRFHP